MTTPKGASSCSSMFRPMEKRGALIPVKLSCGRVHYSLADVLRAEQEHKTHTKEARASALVEAILGWRHPDAIGWERVWEALRTRLDSMAPAQARVCQARAEREILDARTRDIL